MNTTSHTNSSRSRKLWTTVRDELSERRQARAADRALNRELAMFSTQAQVDDLLGAMSGPEAEVDRIRTILTRNVQHRQRTGQVAS